MEAFEGPVGENRHQITGPSPSGQGEGAAVRWKGSAGHPARGYPEFLNRPQDRLRSPALAALERGLFRFRSG